MALLALSIAANVPLGALDNYGTKDIAAKVAQLKPLAADAAFQHTYRIIEKWNLTRTNPAFVPIAALTSGFALALVHRLTRGGWIFVLVVALATLLPASGEHRTAAYFGLAADKRNWLPLPILPAAVAYMSVRRVTKAERWSWAAAGVVFALFAASWWGGHGVLVACAAPAMVLGALAGARVYRALESPTAAEVRAMALIAFTTPFALGCIDLYLRHHTP